jgi:hypothetical protein
MGKVIAYVALLYGKDYLAWSIRSVVDAIDELHVLYTPIGSHGHRTSVPCPETRDELYAIAQTAAGAKLHWHEGTWPHEGAQRDSIHQYAPDADIILVLDADEIWPEQYVSNAGLIYQNWEHGLDRPVKARNYRLPMIHFWRSMHRAVLHDPAYPVRIIYPKIPNGEHTYVGRVVTEQNDPRITRTSSICHMGYAQRPEIVEYKQLTHGHRNEWRKDVNWFQDVFMANRQTDCHPVGSEFWNPETVNPLDYMPNFMSEHPYFGMDVIE